MLKNREWKVFFVKDIFVTFINKGKLQVPTGHTVKKDLLIKGEIPRITATKFNNGVTSFCISTDKGFRVFENFISVSFLREVFYHPYKASLDMKIHCLKLKDRKLTKELSMFLIPLLKKSMDRAGDANYGDQVSSSDLPNKKIILPINKEGCPDYDFMEDYAKRILQKKQNMFFEALKEQREKLGSYVEIENIGDKIWKPFYANEVFDFIDKGKRWTRKNQKNGKIPFISSSMFNNGIDGYVEYEEDKVMYADGLSVANSGSVGSSFYHPYPFYASDHVTIFKNNNFNKYMYLFIATMTRKWKENYNFNREMADKRIKKQKIMLPVKKDFSIDYQYMEQFIKNQLIKKYDELITIIEREQN